MSLDINKTLWGDLKRMQNKAYEDIDNLHSIINLTSSEETKKRYENMLKNQSNRVKRLDERMDKIYDEWNKEMKVIWDFGDFMYHCEHGRKRGIL